MYGLWGVSNGQDINYTWAVSLQSPSFCSFCAKSKEVVFFLKMEGSVGLGSKENKKGATVRDAVRLLQDVFFVSGGVLLLLPSLISNTNHKPSISLTFTVGRLL